MEAQGPSLRDVGATGATGATGSTGSTGSASRYPVAVLARLVEAGLAEVVVGPNGTPTLQIDPVFERARAAAFAGFADADRSRDAMDQVAHQLRPTG